MTISGVSTLIEKMVIAVDLKSMTTDVMLIMTTAAIIISPRFGRISKMSAMRVMKLNKTAGRCAGIIKS